MPYISFKNKKTWFNFINANNEQTPLVLLHGGPGYSSYYLESFKSLPKNIPILFYDQRGCGRSDKINLKEANLKLFVNELETLRKFLNIKKMNLLGHSCGATIALEYYKKYPKRVEKIIFASPFLNANLWKDDAINNIKTLSENTQNIIFNGIKNNDFFNSDFINATKEYNKNFIFRSKIKPLEILESDNASSFEIYNFMWGISEFCLTGTLKDFDNSKNLNKVKIPCLFTAGKFDEVSKKTLEYYREKIKHNNAFIKIYENSAHNPHIEDKNLYLTDIEKFLES